VIAKATITGRHHSRANAAARTRVSEPPESGRERGGEADDRVSSAAGVSSASAETTAFRRVGYPLLSPDLALGLFKWRIC
jgi:hypothetical protein